MNICMFARSLPAHALGGMELHVETLSKAIAAAGHTVHVITTAHPSGAVTENRGNLTVHYVPKTAPGAYSAAWWRLGLRKFEELNEATGFDIVHGQSGGAWYYLDRNMQKKFAAPVVVSLHGTSIDEMKTKLRMIWSPRAQLGFVKHLYVYLFRNRKYLSRASAIIATSDSQAKVIGKYFPVPPERIHLIYNGIDTDLFVPPKSFVRGTKIAAIARLKKEKGIQNLLKAMPRIRAEVPGVTLKIGGDGEYRGRLVRMTASLGISDCVEFLGAVPFSDLPRFMSEADVFVNSTIRENGYDLSIPQAMACGKPVVCSDIRSVLNIVRNGVDGIIYPRNAIDELSREVISLLKDKERAVRIGSSAREAAVEKLGIERMAVETVKVYQTLLGAKA